jgi:carnosine N-methyltransferase
MHSHDHGHSHSHAPHQHGHSHGHSHEPPPPPPPYAGPATPNPASPTEAEHQATVAATWDSYLRTALSANQRRRADYYSLSERHRQLLPDYKELLSQASAYSALLAPV